AGVLDGQPAHVAGAVLPAKVFRGSGGGPMLPGTGRQAMWCVCRLGVVSHRPPWAAGVRPVSVATEQ
ncbi:MAG: hypothetical protein LC808_34170, partial [Actinobacteria bacterium]|nr:hypothetical protein [Actinomycetota bacterium]